jgi:predicted hydrolase (HD superfamily)
MEKALFAVDELTGLIVAAALVRPSKSLHDLQVSSVKKRMKEKSFAAAVSREDIIGGAEALGVPLDEHIATVIEAMRGIAGELGRGDRSAPQQRNRMRGNWAGRNLRVNPWGRPLLP